MLELIYTASPKGLDPSRSGFVTVARTEGFPPNLISPLENLSGYKALFAPDDPSASQNPANYSCQRYTQGNVVWYVVSRITYKGLSYTGRSNNLAHHLLFSREELCAIPGGAAAILADDRNFPEYKEPPHLFGLRRCYGLPSTVTARNGAAWERLCGDAKWARVVAERYRFNRAKGVVLQFTPGTHTAQDILALVADVVELLTPEEAADFTFSTYCYQSSIGNPLFLRAYTADSPYLASIRRMNPHSVIALGTNNTWGADDEELLQNYMERKRQAEEAERERHRQEEERAMERQAMEHYRSERHLDDDKPFGGKDVRTIQEEISQSVNRKVIERMTKSKSSAGTREKPMRRETPPKYVEAPKQKSGSKMFWGGLGIGVVLSILILLGSLWWTGREPSVSSSSAVSQEPENPPVASESASPTDGKRDEKTGETSASKVSSDDSHPTKAEEPAVVEPTAEEDTSALIPPPPVDNGVSERLAFWESFLLKHEARIPLPKRFASGGEITVELSGIGEKTDVPDIHKQTHSTRNQCVIYPLRNGTDESGLNEILVKDDTNGAPRMTLSIEDAELVVKEFPEGELVPCRDNILRLSINGKVLYERELTEELLAVLREEEKLEGHFEYSADHKLIYVANVSDRLLNYRDFVRMEITVFSGGGFDILHKTPKMNYGRVESEMVDLSDVFAMNAKVQEYEKERDYCFEQQNELDRIAKTGFPREYQEMVACENRIKEIRKRFQNIKVSVQDGKDPKLVDLYEMVNRVCFGMGTCLENTFPKTYKPGGNVSSPGLETYYDELIKVKNSLAQVGGYEGCIRDIQSVMDEVNNFCRIFNNCLAYRQGLERKIDESRKSQGKMATALGDFRKSLSEKLTRWLGKRSYEENLKAVLEDDAFIRLSTEKLLQLLNEKCRVESRLEFGK